MSAELATTAPATGATWLDMRSRRVLRYAIGATLATAVALAGGWPLAFLTPVLTLSFLATPAPRPSLRAGLTFVLVVAAACATGYWLSGLFLLYPFVHLTVVGMVLFRLFDAKLRGVSPLLITFLLVAVLLIPFMALHAPIVALSIAKALVLVAAVTISIVWLVYGLLPDPVEPAAPGHTAAPSAPLSPHERLREALTSTLVVMPLVALFYVFQLTSDVLILIFVSLLAMQPAVARSTKAGKALIIGNAIGGLAAIIMFEILVIVPEFEFLIPLTLLVGLIFGALVFSERRMAPLFKMAFSTTLLVIVSTTSSEGDAGAKAYMRVLQLMVVAVYVIVGFRVLDHFSRRREA